ncbi:MAG: Pyridinium-3,5-bisthiocarboxylic acid mononucleotide nickel insertion protein [Acidimicrobiaceae bacterium]|nr:Pyridinium-3,5-bisthiocarboxylic acid mononucleotide nickel insertion protein [Acidimicrobiaceae bacterium]
MSGRPAVGAGVRVAWFNCFAGIAGDMALASLVDAGADLAEIETLLRRVPLGGWAVEAVPVLRGGIAATRVEVTVEDDGVVRTFPAILALLQEAKLPPRVEQRASAVFAALADVEGRLHRRPPAQVHFHEVGGHDAIVDVVGTMAALEVLGVDEIRSSPVSTGTGLVRSQHGLLPNPSPAVLGLLAGAPLTGRDIDVELTTPTGAAILAATATGFGPLPALTIEATGYGAGSRELSDLPNCTQVVLGCRPAESGALETGTGGQPLVLLEANLDDVTGELLSHTLEALLAAGATDAWVTPVVMKKGRPGHVVSVLADLALAPQLRALLAEETGSFGVRTSEVGRFAAERHFEQVEVAGRPVRVKVSPGRAKVEHDDAREVARQEGLPVREVIARAEHAWRLRSTAEPPPGGAS